jgi:hypothetical protein
VRQLALHLYILEMLTDIDKPLDKLEDLTKDEMYVRCHSLGTSIDDSHAYRENMNGTLPAHRGSVLSLISHCRLD